MKKFGLSFQTALCLLFFFTFAAEASAQQTAAPPPLVPKFPLEKSGLELERRVQAGAFLDVLGRKSALYGYERRTLEAWVYPLQILDQFELSFRLEGYPLELRGADTATLINVRPEATTITYTHAAFTVRQIIYAPVGEPGIIMLLEVESALPLGVTVSFRPRLKLMWPAGLMTGNLGWDEAGKFFYIAAPPYGPGAVCEERGALPGTARRDDSHSHSGRAAGRSFRMGKGRD
ncbi:MAG: hypothetical protein LC802_20520 [Acidobacteria bacterium]|nr:hypothetical protein [Acidobacteriota bacterium]